ncbi:teichoic acid ABC transporter permease [Paenibacillus sp. FSL H7-0326]|uniref:ABC transporter permease n=1 Tax=Paenibacillus sp. FSL H7-0326 TaxID=1921144 RepID=UPI00096CAB59|nr:ABC transporter permease [Paenibacillus sp. FSL H7-0326]OMC66560.1 teichoic acid ABC transporter permease [Paenibacillus sp. FSL H7-0326]
MNFVKKAISHTLRDRRLIVDLSKKDFKSKYLGSYLGIAWAFIQPAFMILVYWIVFELGFRTTAVDDIPFVLWLMAAIVPWFFFSEATTNAMYAFTENSYLVKKVVFRISILPIVKILSSFYVHLFFLCILILLLYGYGIDPSIYNIQVLYYLVCLILFVLSISWITSTLMVFMKDIGQFVSMLLQILFWLTPILWDFKIVSEKFEFLFKLNPLFYIVQGYRDSLINHVGFWNYYNLTIYFWLLTASLFLIGFLLFKKLKPHFADVL